MPVKMVGVGAGVARVGDAVKHKGRPEMNEAASIVRQLRDELERYRQRRARRAGWIRRFTSTGLAPLDAVLPHGGLPCGAITEILAGGLGVGTMSLAMRIAGNSVRPTENHAAPAGTAEDHRRIVLVDTFGDFYPPAVGPCGVALDRLIVLRLRRAADAFWAVDQALRCPAVAAVVAPLAKLDERCSRRLQLAAESSGCLGLILTSAHRRTRSFAAVRMLIESVSADEWMGSPAGDCHVCRITLLKIREGMPARPLLVDIQHETGALPLHSLPVHRSAAKTG